MHGLLLYDVISSLRNKEIGWVTWILLLVLREISILGFIMVIIIYTPINNLGAFLFITVLLGHVLFFLSFLMITLLSGLRWNFHIGITVYPQSSEMLNMFSDIRSPFALISFALFLSESLILDCLKVWVLYTLCMLILWGITDNGFYHCIGHLFANWFFCYIAFYSELISFVDSCYLLWAGILFRNSFPRSLFSCILFILSSRGF